METTKAIFERRTLHFFNSQKVQENIIVDSINAANQAPCHKLTFPWKFYSISIKKRNEILDLAIKIKNRKKLLDQSSKNVIRAKYLNPSHLLVASQKLSVNDLTKKEDYAACACAIQNMSISLASNEVFLKWSSGGIIRDETTYDILKINPELEEIIGFLWVGYGKVGPKISRPSISEVYFEI